MRLMTRRSTISALLAAFLLLATGCGAEQGPRPDSAVAQDEEAVTQDGVFEAGADIMPGVYTTSSDEMECNAFVSRTAAFDLMDDNSIPDDWLRGATAATKGQRIVINKGEYLQTKRIKSKSCRWQRETKAGPRSDDPATLAGGCAILTGESGAMAQALKYPIENEPPADEQRRSEIQNRLFAIVTANNPKLADPAGQLVDYLDDPEAYVAEDGRLVDLITEAVDAIKKACGTR
jgi:hypothetical protein